MTLEKAVSIISEINEVKETNKLNWYKPYDYQRSFHSGKDDEGQQTKQKILMAANKTGKTFCGAFEMAVHLTGRYPEWWQGTRFDRPIKAWASGNTSANVRDIVQAECLGEPGDTEDFGKGAIPKDLIISTERAPGIPNAYSTVLIKHISGKSSKLFFKSYEQGAEQWMGKAVDVVWMDEEPPQPIYSQALRATLKTSGLTYMTFTPEKGMTKVVAGFMNDLKPKQQLFNASWDEAPHLDEETKDEILAALPPHERDMRSKGIPVLGSGLVFPVDEDFIRSDVFQIPDHWPRICAIDFGWDHPTACVWIAYDRDQDSVYVYDAYRQSAETPIVHAEAIKSRGEWIPCAWPHDGMQHDKGSGKPLAEHYRKHGINMLGSHFENPAGGQAVEPGLMDMLQRMQSGRFKVFENLNRWFEEMRMYHRIDGKLVKERDDLMSATRYAVMSIRYASLKRMKPLPAFAVGSNNDYPFFQNNYGSSIQFAS